MIEKKNVVTPGQDSEERVSTTIAVTGDEHNNKHSFASSISFSSNKQREDQAAWESHKSQSKADGDFLNHIRGNASGSAGSNVGNQGGYSYGGSYGLTNYGNNNYGQNNYGQNNYGQTNYGQNNYGQNNYGQTNYGQNNYGGSYQPTYASPW